MQVLVQRSSFSQTCCFGNDNFVDPKKVRTSVNLKHLKNITEIRNFLGIIRYYRQFVKYLSLIVAPLTQLTWKGVKLEWDDWYVQNFQELKKCLVSARSIHDVINLFGVSY